MGLKKDIHIFALGVTGDGISGGDRIFLEFAKRWSKQTKVTIWTSKEGIAFFKRQKVKQDASLKYVELNNKFNDYFFIDYIHKIFLSIYLGFKLDINNSILFAASNFWMDLLTPVILKIKSKNNVLVSGWYMSAPNPFVGYAEVKRKNKYKLKALIYWLILAPMKILVVLYADKVLVNNEVERGQFKSKNKAKNVLPVLGAVNLEEIEKWKSKNKRLAKKYDAVFQGRLHPQKGVLELIEIWSKVVKEIPAANLAVIGGGPLKKLVDKKVKELGLKKNIIFFGFVFDGDKKYKIFDSSKMVLHPAFYDSGGMAAAEAMAFGIPAVGFDLKAYKSYYPEGMVKISEGDLGAFSQTVIMLIRNNKLRNKIGKQAFNLIKSSHNWKKRSSEVYDFIVD